MSKPPRNERNANPFNLRKSRDPWQGLAAEQVDREFFTFKSAVWGIRAGVRTLITYQDKHQLKSIRQMIGRFAPPNENNTEVYIRAVASAVGVDPDAEIDVTNYAIAAPMTAAIIKHEGGRQPYAQDVIDEGLKLAGVTKGRASVPVKSATVAVVATAAEKIIENVPQAQVAVDALGVPWLSAALTIIGIAAAVYVAVHAVRRMKVEA